MKLLGKAAFTAAFAMVLSAMPLHITVATAQTEPELIALTFDDGPNTTTTNEVLDVLEEYGARASFFLIGTNINAESAESVKRAYAMGCEIDNHSKTHSNMGGMAVETMQEEINFVDEQVEAIIGEKTKFFRPPFIDVSQTMYDTIEQPFICGIDCRDFMADVTAEQRSEYIINNAEDGVIVLLHDAAGNSQTVEAIKTVIPTLQKEGYEFVTLTELFERQGETPRGDMMYSRVAKYPCKDYTLHSNLFTGEAVGDSSWSGWSNTAVLDAALLETLGDTYAIEVEYRCSNPPVIALQKWSGTPPVWSTVQPYYANGEKACFLAADLQKALDTLGVKGTELDRMTITPSAGSMTVTNVDLLVMGEPAEKIAGDVNADGKCNVADVVTLQKWLLAAPVETLSDKTAADLNQDGKWNALDLVLLKQMVF